MMEDVRGWYRLMEDDGRWWRMVKDGEGWRAVDEEAELSVQSYLPNFT